MGLLNDRGREVMRGRITVPVIVDGGVLTMTGRAVLPGLKRHYLDLPLPPHALGVDLVRDHRRVVLVEGVVDYLVALEWRIPVVSAMGTHASPEVRAEICDATHSAEVIPVALDGDDAGAEAGEAWLEWLGSKLAPVTWPAGINDVGDLGYLPEGAVMFRQMLAEAEERWRAESTLRTNSHAA